jgi:glutamyl/glutaminyl-tRNA synthetase
VLVQSEHFAEYLKAADKRIAMGLLYPCFASRGEIAAAADPAKTDPDGAPLYPGLWKGASADAISARMAAGEAPALKLDMDGRSRLRENAVTCRSRSPRLARRHATDDRRRAAALGRCRDRAQGRCRRHPHRSSSMTRARA